MGRPTPESGRSGWCDPGTASSSEKFFGTRRQRRGSGSACSAMPSGTASAWCGGWTYSRISSRRSRVRSPYARPRAAATEAATGASGLQGLERAFLVLPHGPHVPPGPVRRTRNAAFDLRQDTGAEAPWRP